MCLDGTRHQTDMLKGLEEKLQFLQWEELISLEPELECIYLFEDF